MLYYSSRNTGENSLPADAKRPATNDPQLLPRPTLEQLMHEVAANSSPTSDVVRNPEKPRQAPPQETAVEPAPLGNRPPAWKPSLRPVGPIAPLAYRKPTQSNAKLVPVTPMEWSNANGAAKLMAPSRLSQPIAAVQPTIETRKADKSPGVPLDTMSTAEHHLPSGTIGKMLPTELIYALQAQVSHDSIYKKLVQFCKTNAHNPLLELASGTVAFVARDEKGILRVFIGSMRDFSLYSVRTNMLDGTLAIEELFEYEESYDQIVVINKRASEIAPSQVAGRKMFPLLEFSAYTLPGAGKATFKVKTQWR